MKKVLVYAGYILIIAVAGFLLWRFYYLMVWIFFAAVISFIGLPLVRFFDRMHVKNIRMPHFLSALFALAIIVLVFFGLLAVLVPLLINQAQTILNTDVANIADNFDVPLQWLEVKMKSIGLLTGSQNIEDFLIDKARSVVKLENLSVFINRFFSIAGSFFIGLFSIFFIAFFFLKDENMFEESLLLFVPEKRHASVRKVVASSKRLLVRYFVGVMAEVIGVMTIITILLSLFGIKNALLIGFFGAIMNVIPYLGPFIGSIIGIMLGLTGAIASGDNELLPVFLKLSGVFLFTNFVDNNILVPFIYSSSVKAHPLEIFFVIIIGGSLAGILGMIMAVPVYTIMRVIASEFFNQVRIVQRLTRKLKS